METCCGSAMALSMPGYKVTGRPPSSHISCIFALFFAFWDRARSAQE